MWYEGLSVRSANCISNIIRENSPKLEKNPDDIKTLLKELIASRGKLRKVRGSKGVGPKIEMEILSWLGFDNDPLYGKTTLELVKIIHGLIVKNTEASNDVRNLFTYASPDLPEAIKTSIKERYRF